MPVGITLVHLPWTSALPKLSITRAVSALRPACMIIVVVDVVVGGGVVT